ncbi:MAG: PIN domain-containing protein [Candidatus Sulfotelmatobacter sp.]
MGVGRLRTFVQSHRLIALDTSVFMYQLDANIRYLPLSDVVFAWLLQRGNAAVSSTLSLTELLVPAYQESDQPRIQSCYGFLATFPNLSWVPPTLEIADGAARVRASYRLSTSDAIQAATAIFSKASVLISNDPVFKRVKEIDSLVLDDLL